eukprot:SAG31_NODE_705_length_12695_cov_3.147007_3_plen_232_part_00
MEDKNPAFQKILSNFESDKLSVAYGWTMVDEHKFTASVTHAGGYVHASDFAYNLAFLSQLPVSSAARRSPTVSQKKTESVHTVAFVMSDGDNIQLLQNDWMSTQHWNHPARGTVPAGWSYSPATAVLMPSILDYVHRTATANDSLSTGPSGIGYAYPQLYTPKMRRQHAAATGQLMSKAGMTVANVIGVTPSRQSLAELARHEHALTAYTNKMHTSNTHGLVELRAILSAV